MGGYAPARKPKVNPRLIIPVSLPICSVPTHNSKKTRIIAYLSRQKRRENGYVAKKGERSRKEGEKWKGAWCDQQERRTSRMCQVCEFHSGPRGCVKGDTCDFIHMKEQPCRWYTAHTRACESMRMHVLITNRWHHTQHPHALIYFHLIFLIISNYLRSSPQRVDGIYMHRYFSYAWT